jgi:3-hydroxyacyl-CoA dehydrogenase
MKEINKVAVLGSGTMGSAIAAHLANAGIEVILLDIIPTKLRDDEEKKGLTLNSKEVRNRIVNENFERLVKSKPKAFYLNSYASYIKLGNFEDDISKIKDADWIVEAVLEEMDVKKKLFSEKLIPNCKNGAIISTNTSGLSVNAIASILPGETRKNFLGIHFFNPPRYMRLVEIIPNKETDRKVIDFMSKFISKRLGKVVVYAKDTPNFIANRIGAYMHSEAFKHLVGLKMTVEEADTACVGTIGFPKTGIFKLGDLVGVDLMLHVGNNTYSKVNDEEKEIFKPSEILNEMVKKGLLGNKSGKGFYKQEKVNGKSVVYYYDVYENVYKESQRPKFDSVEATKNIDDVNQRIKTFLSHKDKASQFAWYMLRDMLIYTFKRIPEIADDILNVDRAMEWGYGWEIGPFKMFDAIGVKDFVEMAQKDGKVIPEKLKSIDKFYKFENGKELYLDLNTSTYKEIQYEPTNIKLDILKKNNKVVEENSSASLIDIGDGVFCLEFHTKMNSLGAGIVAMTNKAIKRAEEDGIGLVIGNESTKAFSVGANLVEIANAISQGAWDDINASIKQFQSMTMGLKYANVPCVAAPHGLALGGGCEICLHSDAIVAHAETYMGLVEVGVGLIPGGGGTKEMALRAIENAQSFNILDVTSFVGKYFENITMAKVTGAAREAFEFGYMDDSDSITMNIDNLIYDAKQKVISLSTNYIPSKPKVGLKAPGKDVFATIKTMLWTMQRGNYISEYDAHIGEMVAYVMTGGDVNPGTLITEEYLVELEREAFLKLCGDKKTQERIQYMLKTNKPFRN